MTVSVKKGRLRTKSGIFDSSLGKNGETTNTQTYVGKQIGLVLFTEIFLNYRPSGIWGSYMDSPPLETTHYPRWGLFSRTVVILNRGPSTPEAVSPEGHPFQPGTVHTRGRFPGWSPLPTGDRPHWDLFSRTVAFQNRGPSTPEAVSPDSRLSKLATVHTGTCFPGQSSS